MKNKYYVNLEFFRNQSKKYGRYTILFGLLGKEKEEQSLRKIGQKCGIKTPQQVKHYLLQMINEGILYKENGKYLFTKNFIKNIKII